MKKIKLLRIGLHLVLLAMLFGPCLAEDFVTYVDWDGIAGGFLEYSSLAHPITVCLTAAALFACFIPKRFGRILVLLFELLLIVFVCFWKFLLNTMGSFGGLGSITYHYTLLGKICIAVILALIALSVMILRSGPAQEAKKAGPHQEDGGGQGD